MKAIVNTGAGRLELLELPMPQPAAGEVRIRTAACAICATDLKMISGWQRTGFPSVPGHEWSGTVDAVGERVDASLIGKRCVAENVLRDGGEVGFEHPGAYGQYFVTEADNLHLIPADFSPHLAALTEPVAVSMHALKRLGNAEEPFLIFGDGPIGLILVTLLIRAGKNNVVVVGGREERLNLASELGATETFNYHRQAEGLAEIIHQKTSTCFPTIIDASGSANAMAASFELIAPRGKILVMGDYGDARANFLWNDVMHREVQIIGSCSGAGARAEAVRLAVEGNLPFEELVTHRFAAEEFREAFDLMRNRNAGVIKIVLEWE